MSAKSAITAVAFALGHFFQRSELAAIAKSRSGPPFQQQADPKRRTSENPPLNIKWKNASATGHL